MGEPKKSKTILVAIDDAEESEAALEWYMDHCHVKGDTIVLVYASEENLQLWLQLSSGKMAMTIPESEWEKIATAGANKVASLEKKYTEKLAKYEVTPTFLTQEGRPGPTILQFAKEVNADLILVGNRGHGKLKRAILGSVSTYVMHHAKVPVLVHRPIIVD